MPAVLAEQQRESGRGSAPEGTLTRTGQVLLALVAVELVAIYAPTAGWLLDRWTMSVWHNAHGMLIPLLVGYFIREELGRLRRHGLESSAWGFVFLVPAIAMHALDAGIHSQLLSAVSLVVMLPGLSLLFLGAARTRAIAFPLAFLVLMLPIPLALTGPLHLALRRIATAGTAAVLPVLNITAYTEDTTIQLANAHLLVGDACSGFSTLYASVAVAALVAYSCYVPWRRAAVLLAAAPIAILANIVRVIILVAVVDATGIDVLETWIHPASGMLTFALALPLIFWIGTPRRTRRSS